MTQEAFQHRMDWAKISVMIATLGFVYTLYNDVSKKLDVIISTRQELIDHKASDDQIHTVLNNNIEDVRNRLDNHVKNKK